MKPKYTLQYNLLLVCILFFTACSTQVSKPKMVFNEEGTFKIAQLTDIHYIYGNKSSEEALDQILNMLRLECPDLIILTGDMIFDRAENENAIGDKSFSTLIRAIASLQTPFALTFGNHDHEQGLTHSQLLQSIESIPHNLTQQSKNISGDTNYTLEVYQKDKSNPTYVLYVLDSHAYSQIEGVDGYDFIKADQINWYRDQSNLYQKKNNNKPIPALAFFHIPTPEFTIAAQSLNNKLIGTYNEAVCSPVLNSGFFSAIKQQNDIQGLFVGHDHDNDFAVPWQGVLLAYGRYSGGNTVYNHLDGNGIRLIELNTTAATFTTWIRTSKGVLNKVIYPTDFVNQSSTDINI